MPEWLLLDYGQVLCTAPPADEWDELRRAAGYHDPDDFHRTYWKHRPPYDRGDVTAADFWATVAPETRRERLMELDVRIWLHPHLPSVAAMRAAGERGWRLALFSNAPVEVADAIDALEWLEPVERRFYSCRIGWVKPEPDAYRRVLDGLKAEPANVVFFDDRPDNVAAARAAGMIAHVFTDAAQIEAV